MRASLLARVAAEVELALQRLWEQRATVALARDHEFNVGDCVLLAPSTFASSLWEEGRAVDIPVYTF